MEIFLASIATEEYESMASALIEMGATDTNVDVKAFASDLEKMFSSIKASIKLRSLVIVLCFPNRVIFLVCTSPGTISKLWGNNVSQNGAAKR